MAKNNIIFNHTLEQYNKKYRNRREHLLKVSKKEVEDYDKKYGHYIYNGKTNNLDFNNYLLENRKWWFIKEDNCYHEIPRPIRFSWFRNLKLSVQIATYAVLGVGAACAIVFPVIEANKVTYTVSVNEEANKYVDIDVGEIEVGKPLKTEFILKDSAKETKQLPKKLKVVKTGDVVLPEYNKPSTNSKSVIQNEVEPENYYTYTLISKDKADLYIKKVLGPISVELDIEERKYTVTFDADNGQSKQLVEVIKNNKVSKPTDPIKDLCSFNYWSLENSNEPFNFDTLINEDITLKAHWLASETGVIIRGINGMVNHYSTMQDAYQSGLEIMKGLNTDLDSGTCSKEKFLETFNDVTIDENGYYNANITWELYTKNDETLNVPADCDHYFFYFGRNSNALGEGAENLFIKNITLKGVTDNKPNLKINTNSLQQTTLYLMKQNVTKTLNVPASVNFNNIAFDDSAIKSGDFIYQGSSGMINPLTFDSCSFINKLYIESPNEGGKDVTVNNCLFNGNPNSSVWALQFESPTNHSSKNYLKFTNNTVKNYIRGIQLNCKNMESCLIEGNTFTSLNKIVEISGYERKNAAIQLSNCKEGMVFDINNNTFDDCATNCFKFHSGFKFHAVINIYSNTIKNCGYVGLSETDKKDGWYTLNSGDNTIINTSKDKAGSGSDKTTETSDPERVIVLNEKAI